MADDELVAVVQIYRHGERVPVKIFPTNPRQNDFYWPAEAGELTNRGKTQMYELGKFTRGRYKNFLPEIFTKKETRLYATETERSNISAQLFGAGLYPPTSKEIWNNELRWNPIPIFTSEPHILHVTPKLICPLYRKLYNEVLGQRFEQLKQDPVFEYIATHSGQSLNELMDILLVFDTCNIERNMGLEIPEWTKEVFPLLHGCYISYFSFVVATDQMRRLALGPIFNEIILHFERMSTDSSSGPKLIAYCGHDTNIASILDTFQAFDPHCPENGSSIFLELRKKNGESFINVFYKRDEVAPVQIAGKYFDISLDEFKELYSNLLIDKDQFCSECSLSVGLDEEDVNDIRPF